MLGMGSVSAGLIADLQGMGSLSADLQGMEPLSADLQEGMGPQTPTKSHSWKGS